eukprot:TRINITY_DN40957_c0_g1_i1.p1 TRINITY_DN40957_c0_g1~~TRINITY_DN40957_c0_g1_i1.p1  ORF type:complete len:340 (+),score=58.36 TRINITY_DN40957_c0_g1_i1:195-1214(+)
MGGVASFSCSGSLLKSSGSSDRKRRSRAQQGTLDTRRKAAIATGAVVDHGDNVIMVKSAKADLDGTIFQNVKGAFPRKMITRTFARTPYWNECAIDRITTSYSAVERPIPIDKPIYDFMLTECDFAMEHADGSFMDHLKFCHDYCAHHFKGQSPRVLLLHSIMGVGFNYFPMKVEKIPKLQALVSPQEMKHIESFPSILRLLLTFDLLKELESKVDSLDNLRSIKFHRVLDNKDLQLDAEEFWVHLNYQLIRFIDFLPPTDWNSQASFSIFQIFLRLRALLSRAGKLKVNIAVEPVPIKGFKATLKRFFSNRAMRRFSKEIGHDLDYEIDWLERQEASA